MDEIHALEALLFASGDPVSTDRLAQVLEISRENVIRCADALESEYEKRGAGIRVIRLEDGYQLASRPEYADTVVKLMRHRKPPKLSQAALEVLAIVAYFQPTLSCGSWTWSGWRIFRRCRRLHRKREPRCCRRQSPGNRAKRMELTPQNRGQW